MMATNTLVGTVPGRAPGTSYVLVKSAERQYMVNRRVFVGDWDGLKPGDRVELIVIPGECSRVLSARLVNNSE